MSFCTSFSVNLRPIRRLTAYSVLRGLVTDWRFAEVVFGGLLHLAQDFSRDLLGRQLLVAHADPRIAVVGFGDRVRHQRDVFLDFLFVELAADQALDGEQGVFRVGDGLALGRRANQDLAIFLVSDDRRRRARAFCVFDDLRLAIFHDRNARVGGAQVDTDDSAHDFFL